MSWKGVVFYFCKKAIRNSGVSSFMSTDKTETSDTPVYVHWRHVTAWGKEWRAMVLSLFFAENPGYAFGLGRHAADVERLFVLFDDDGAPAHVYFGAHGRGQGVWREWKHCMFTFDGLLKVFVARGSNGFYPAPGVYRRVLGLLSDECRADNMWIVRDADMNDASKQSWSSQYQVARGINSPLHVSSPVEHSITPSERNMLMLNSVQKRLKALPLCESRPCDTPPITFPQRKYTV
jgi:hypothetical protein